MKFKVIFIGIFFSALLTSFVGQHIQVYFYLFDNENFTENHCINKDKPESKCNGACQLKKLASDDEDNTNTTPTKPEIQSVDLFLCQDFNLIFPTFFVLFTEHRFSFAQFLTFPDSDAIFSPPKIEFA